MTAAPVRPLELSADSALFSGEVNGLIAVCQANERPLGGLAGLLDWRFQGQISDHIRAGAITGKEGECVYLPVTRNGMTYHLVLVGGGYSEQTGHRTELKSESLKLLQKNLSTLRIPKIGISCSDFGDVDADYFSNKLKGVPLWIVQ